MEVYDSFNMIYSYNQSFILVKNNVNTKGGILTTMKLSRGATWQVVVCGSAERNFWKAGILRLEQTCKHWTLSVSLLSYRIGFQNFPKSLCMTHRLCDGCSHVRIFVFWKTIRVGRVLSHIYSSKAESIHKGLICSWFFSSNVEVIDSKECSESELFSSSRLSSKSKGFVTFHEGLQGPWFQVLSGPRVQGLGSGCSISFPVCFDLEGSDFQARSTITMTTRRVRMVTCKAVFLVAPLSSTSRSLRGSFISNSIGSIVSNFSPALLKTGSIGSIEESFWILSSQMSCSKSIGGRESEDPSLKITISVSCLCSACGRWIEQLENVKWLNNERKTALANSTQPMIWIWKEKHF